MLQAGGSYDTYFVHSAWIDVMEVNDRSVPRQNYTQLLNKRCATFIFRITP